MPRRRPPWRSVLHLTAFRRSRSRVRSWLGRSVAVARFIHRVRQDNDHDPWVSADTELVIDGFPRCGNTYLVGAVLVTNPGRRVSHHTHNASNVIDAVRRGVPVIVVTRDPLEACASLAQREPHLPRDEALRWYRDFHKRILRVRESLLIAPFPGSVNEPGRVIDEANQRFGTSFVSYVPSEENEAAVQAWIEGRAVSERGLADFEQRVARPSEERAANRQLVETEIEAAYPRLVSECRALWSDLVTGTASR